MSNKLNTQERSAILALASVYGLRMFGLFLILPVLSLYSEQLADSTPALMGLALGVYGVTQAILQIPFGVLSDKYGRKPLIVIGLLLFASGGLVAAASSTILGVIVGRALQGAGAIAAVVLALTADLTRESQRTKAMASIGMTIGFSFMLALLAAPALQEVIGVPGMFVMTSVLALLSIIVIWKLVPTPVQNQNLEVSAVPQTMMTLLKDRQLIRLDIGIFILHFVLTALFLVVPIMLVNQLGLQSSEHWQIYLPSLLVSVVLMVPFIILSSKQGWLKPVFLIALALLVMAQLSFSLQPENVVLVIVSMTLFFWGFNLLEALLPSLVSKLAPAATRGSAMGVYNTFQFMGIFFGGLVGGILYGASGYTGVFLACIVLLIIWALLVVTAPSYTLLESLIVKLKAQNVPSSQVAKQLLAVSGVEQVVIKNDVAYLKVNKPNLDETKLADIALHN